MVVPIRSNVCAMVFPMLLVVVLLTDLPLREEEEEEEEDDNDQLAFLECQLPGLVDKSQEK